MYRVHVPTSHFSTAAAAAGHLVPALSIITLKFFVMLHVWSACIEFLGSPKVKIEIALAAMSHTRAYLVNIITSSDDYIDLGLCCSDNQLMCWRCQYSIHMNLNTAIYYHVTSSDWRSVTLDVDYAFNPSSGERLYISTDSTLNSGDMISVKFGFDSTDMSTLSIYFDDVMKYNIEGCSESNVRDAFSTAPSTLQQKTWIISVSDSGLKILCNGVEVLDYDFGTAHSGSTCSVTTFGNGQIITRATFTSSDTATDAYKVDGNTQIFC